MTDVQGSSAGARAQAREEKKGARAALRSCAARAGAAKLGQNAALAMIVHATATTNPSTPSTIATLPMVSPPRAGS